VTERDEVMEDGKWRMEDGGWRKRNEACMASI